MVILANCVTLAMNNPLADDAEWQVVLDNIFLALYTVEMVLKIGGLGFIFNRNSYLRDYWNLLDFVIVITAYIPLVLNSGTVNLKALRSLRVLRPLRTISSIRSLRNVVTTLLKALPMLVDSLLIVFFLIMVFSIAGLQLFAGYAKRRCFDPTTGRLYIDENGKDIICGSRNCPLSYACGKTTFNPENDLSNFDTIANAFLTCFQVVTMEGWSTIMYETMDAFTPIAFIFFILLVFMASYFLLNILLAVIKAKFSESAHSKNDGKILTYDEKFAKLLDVAKLNVLEKIKTYRLNEGEVSTYYQLKPNGTLQPTKKSAKKSSKKNKDDGILRRMSTLAGKFLSKRTLSTNTLKQCTTLPLSPKNTKMLTQEDKPEHELHNSDNHTNNNQINGGLVRHNSPSGFTTDGERQNPMPSDRQNLLKTQNKDGTPLIDESKLVSAHSLSNQPLKSDIPIAEVKEEHLENSIVVQPVEDQENRDLVPKKRRPTFIEKRDPTPIRPQVTKEVILTGNAATRPPLMIGIAGISKSKVQNGNMRALEMEDLFMPTKTSKISPISLFEKGSDHDHPLKLGTRSGKRRRSTKTHRTLIKGRTPKHSVFEEDLIDSFEVSSVEPSVNYARRRLGSKKSIISDGEMRSGSHTGTYKARKSNSKKSLADLDGSPHRQHRGTRMDSAVSRVFDKREDKREDSNVARAVFGNHKPEGTEEGEEDIINVSDEEKFYLDIRAFKMVPLRKKEYQSSSQDSVLPKVFEKKRDLVLQKQMDKIRYARPVMVYPLDHGKRKKRSRSANGEDPSEKSGLVSSATSIPIRKRTRSQSASRPLMSSVTMENKNTAVQRLSTTGGVQRLGTNNGLQRMGTQSSFKMSKKLSVRSDTKRASSTDGDAVPEGGVSETDRKQAQLNTIKKFGYKNVGEKNLGLQTHNPNEKLVTFEDYQTKIHEELIDPEEEKKEAADGPDVMYMKLRVTFRSYRDNSKITFL